MQAKWLKESERGPLAHTDRNALSGLKPAEQSWMKLTAIGLCALCCSAPAYADDVADEKLSLKGFGTLGAVYHNTPGGVAYRRDYAQSFKTMAYAGQVSFAPDSMVGVQGEKRLDERWDAVMQVLSRMDAAGSFDPRVTMGYAKFRAGDNFVRLGRMTIETYMKGDVAEVGYANLPVRQPVVIYPRTFNGMDAETTQPLGAGLLRLKAMYGRTVGKIPNQGMVTYDMAGSVGTGGLLEYSLSGWTVRSAMYSIKLKDEFSALQPGGALYDVLVAAPNGTEVFNRVSMRGRRISNQMLMVEYDKEAVQAEVGYTLTRSHDWPLHRETYAILGYRIDVVTPYVSYASSRYARHFASAYPAGLSAATDQVNEALMQMQAGMLSNQDNVALGLRYDFAKGKALKLQYDRIRYQDPESIVDPGLSTTPVAALGYKTMRLYSVALDFVF